MADTNGTEYIENALLAFVTSASHCKSKNEILNIGCVFYDENKIKNAKELLFNKLNKKLIWRRSEHKSRENLSDIIDLMTKCDEEQVQIPKFVCSEYDGFPPSNGFEVIGGYVKQLIDQVHDLKNELNILKEVKMDSVNDLQEKYFIKEELLEIKGIVKDLKHRMMFESVTGDNLIVKNVDGAVNNSKNLDTVRRFSVDQLLNIIGEPSAPSASQVPRLSDSFGKFSLASDEPSAPSASQIPRLSDNFGKFLLASGEPSAPSLSQLSRNSNDFGRRSSIMNDRLMSRDEDNQESPLHLPSYSQVLKEVNLSPVAVVPDCASSSCRLPCGDAVLCGMGVATGQHQEHMSETGLMQSTKPKPRIVCQSMNDSLSYNKRRPIVDKNGFTLVQHQQDQRARISASNARRDGKEHHLSHGGRRRPTVRGTKDVRDSRFKATMRTSDIYIGNVDMETSSDDIIKYVEEEFNVKVIECVKLTSRFEKSWTSFKLTVNVVDRIKLLQPEGWPDQIVVRKYYYIDNKNNENHGQSSKL